MDGMFGRNRVIFAVAAGLLSWAMRAPVAAQQPLQTESEKQWFTNVRQLTSVDMGLDRAGEAYFSPDMKRISFQAYPRGRDAYQIYVLNLDGTGLKMVSTGEGATTCSFFHPSGEKLIFAANHHDQRPPRSPEEVEPFRSRGGGHASDPPMSQPASKPGRPAHGGQAYAWQYFPGMELFEYVFASGALTQLTFSEGYDAECAYSPDGKHIVFSSFRDGDEEIYICAADARNPRRITHAQGKDGGPFFSPDGQRICYRSDRVGDGTMQVFVNNLDGTDERPLTDHKSFHWCPYWHPSGRWLIFAHTVHRADGPPNFDLHLVRDDGSQTLRVTDHPSFDGLPVFSPDGTKLMWTSRRGGIDAPQIFIADFVGLTPAGELRAAP